MIDRFYKKYTNISDPVTLIETVVPSDTEDLDSVSRAISVTGSGTVKVTTVGETVGIIYVAAGAVYPIRVSRIWNSDTTATGIVSLS